MADGTKIEGISEIRRSEIERTPGVHPPMFLVPPPALPKQGSITPTGQQLFLLSICILPARTQADSPPQCALLEQPPATPLRQRLGPLPCNGRTESRAAASAVTQIAAEPQPQPSASGREALDLAAGHNPRPHSPPAPKGSVSGEDLRPAEPPRKRQRLERTPVPHPGPHVAPSGDVRAGDGGPSGVSSGPAGTPKPLGPAHGGSATPSTAARRAARVELHASPAVMREWLGRSSSPAPGAHVAEAGAAAAGSSHGGGPAGQGNRVRSSPPHAVPGAPGPRGCGHGSCTAGGGGRRVEGATQVNGNPLAASPVGPKDGRPRSRLSMGRGTPGDCPATPGTLGRGGGSPSGPGLAAPATAGGAAGAGAGAVAAKELSLRGQAAAGGVTGGELTGTPSRQVPGAGDAGGCAGEALGGREEAAPGLASPRAGPAAMAAPPAGTGGNGSATIGTNAPISSCTSHGDGEGAPSAEGGAAGGPGAEADPVTGPQPSRGPSPGPSLPRPVRRAATRANDRIQRTFEVAKPNKPPQQPQQQQQHSRPPRPLRSRTPDSIGNAGGSVAAGQAAAGARAAGAGNQRPSEGQRAQGHGHGAADGGGDSGGGEVLGRGGVQPCFYMVEEALRQRRELGPAAAQEAAPGTPLHALGKWKGPGGVRGVPNPGVLWCSHVSSSNSKRRTAQEEATNRLRIAMCALGCWLTGRGILVPHGNPAAAVPAKTQPRAPFRTTPPRLIPAIPCAPAPAPEHPPCPGHLPGLDPNPAVVYCNLVLRGTLAHVYNWLQREARKVTHTDCAGACALWWKVLRTGVLGRQAGVGGRRGLHGKRLSETAMVQHTVTPRYFIWVNVPCRVMIFK